MPERTWEGLTGAQADGRACVVCHRRFRLRGSVAVPVGRSDTGTQVFACPGTCAKQATDVAGPGGSGELVIPVEALTAAGAAFLEALERATAATPTGDPRHAWPDDLVEATVQAGAPLIVAAELRRLAGDFQRLHRALLPGEALTRHRSLLDCADAARARADELDPAGGGR